MNQPRTAHTPGPWKWWTSNSWRRLRSDDRGRTLNVLEPYVCRDGHPDLSVSDADMALIAAAPDLLEALEQAIDDMGDGFSVCPAAKEQMRAAIAKAEGQP